MINKLSMWGSAALRLIANMHRLAVRARVVTFPNAITLTRIVILPSLYHCLVNGEWHRALVLISYAGLTDFFDGYLARRFNMKSRFGHYLDPLADKLFLITCWTGLYISSPSFSIPLWFPVFVVLRELVLMVGGFFLITSGKGAFVSPSLGGKLTTFFHITSIVWLFACGFMGWHPVRTYKLLLPLLALVSLVSLVSYAKEFARCVEKDSSSS